MTKGRNITFDIMKGIGILLVMTCHFFGWNHHWLSNTINSFHMPMFFIVAGFFSKSFVDKATSKSCIKKYFNRLFWPFCFTQVLIVLWCVIMVFSQNDSWNLAVNNALSIFWADVYGPKTPWGELTIGIVWFLLALLIAKIILIPLSRTEKWAIPISLLLAYSAILLHKIFPYSIWCIALGLTALPFVTIGWWAKSHNIPQWIKIVIIIAWPIAILFSKVVMYDMTWQCYPLDVLGACGGTYCFYLLCDFLEHNCKLLSKIFASLGVWSLAIMCFHHFELQSHLTNHILALTSISFPAGIKYVFEYVFTIGMATIVVHTPKIKKIFV